MFLAGICQCLWKSPKAATIRPELSLAAAAGIRSRLYCQIPIQLKVGVVEVPDQRASFRSFSEPIKPNTEWKLRVWNGRDLKFELTSLDATSRAWRLEQRLVDVKCVIRSQYGLILCFSTAPKVFEGNQRSIDMTMAGGVQCDRILPTFHHYLIDGDQEMLLSLFSSHDVTTIQAYDEHKVQNVPASDRCLEAYDTFRAGLRTFCFQASYQVEHLVAQGALHPATILETFSDIYNQYSNSFSIDPEVLCNGLERLPAQLASEFESTSLSGRMPTLYASSTQLQDCLKAEEDNRSCDGAVYSSLQQRIRYSRIEKTAVAHYLDQSTFSPPDWKHMRDSLSWSHRTSDVDDESQRYMLMRRAFVTPSGVKVGKEQFELSNRVVRRYWDHRDRFLRVKFCDESLQWYPTSNGAMSRVEEIFMNGLDVCGRRYEVVAFSASQLRQQSAWFFASCDELSAKDIVDGLGDFSKIKNPAKFFARLGQSFSATYPVRKIENLQQRVKDIKEVTANNYIFSDGVGRISSRLAQSAAEALYGNGKNSPSRTSMTSSGAEESFGTPSAFQIRYGGYKGVVSVYPDMDKDIDLELRGSMKKFESDQCDLEVIRATERLPGYLNRQFITLLSALGINDNVFKELQEEMVNSLKAVTKDREIALQTLYMHGCHLHNNPLNSVVHTLRSGISPSAEPFLLRGLTALAKFSLQNLRDRTSIPVPKSAILMGVMDEEKELNSGEVFIAVRNPSTGEVDVIEGDIIVGKNPCYHPGDIRKLRAVNHEKLHHLVDCVVFPQVGSRPHPDECSGSDLDGDLYFVSWEPRLIPEKHDKPMDYSAKTGQALDLAGADFKAKMGPFFFKYLKGCTIGRISNSHLAISDQEGARSNNCLELADMYSVAVDFPKTGVPAYVRKGLFPGSYPDFMQHSGSLATYESEKVLGQLYRSSLVDVKNASVLDDAVIEGKWQADHAFNHKAQAEHSSGADAALTSYSNQIGLLLQHFKVKSEAELFVGLIDPVQQSDQSSRKLLDLGHSYWHDLRYFAQMEANLLVRRFYNSVFINGETSVLGDAWLEKEYYFLGKASAWYHTAVSESHAENSRHCLSFPWIAHRQLCYMKERQLKLQAMRGPVSH